MTPDEVLKKHNIAGDYKFLIPVMKEYALLARIQERRNCIYNLESDLMDNGPEGEGIYHEHYVRAMQDEISNHNAFIQDLEKELEKLNQ